MGFTARWDQVKTPASFQKRGPKFNLPTTYSHTGMIERLIPHQHYALDRHLAAGGGEPDEIHAVAVRLIGKRNRVPARTAAAAGNFLHYPSVGAENFNRDE